MTSKVAQRHTSLKAKAVPLKQGSKRGLKWLDPHISKQLVKVVQSLSFAAERRCKEAWISQSQGSTPRHDLRIAQRRAMTQATQDNRNPGISHIMLLPKLARLGHKAIKKRFPRIRSAIVARYGFHPRLIRTRNSVRTVKPPLNDDDPVARFSLGAPVIEPIFQRERSRSNIWTGFGIRMTCSSLALLPPDALPHVPSLNGSLVPV
ncbi:hypothetical protein VTL71DRAFT_12620 [Oculimacula yallundae]|uniref:Uncharacterized protein n=1 Tax=Oculimacula yallundae TaxID=86028 RepID=A0ABR4CN67_9HELO